MAFERCLQAREDVFVAVQVRQRFAGRFEQFALRVEHLDVDADQRVVLNFHAAIMGAPPFTPMQRGDEPCVNFHDVAGTLLVGDNYLGRSTTTILAG
jgi:hypothetical protein